MITGFGGLPGSGKTTRLAQVTERCLYEAKYIHTPKYGKCRDTRINIKLSPSKEDEYAGFFTYYNDLTNLDKIKNCNLIIDEGAIYYPSREWDAMPYDHRRFLMKHRHYDVDIWYTVQDLKTLDNSFRRLTNHYWYFERMIATPEPSPYKKNKRYPYLLTRSRLIPRELYDLESNMYVRSEQTKFHFFTRKSFALFDTHQDLPPVPPPPIIKENRRILYVGGIKDGTETSMYIKK